MCISVFPTDYVLQRGKDAPSPYHWNHLVDVALPDDVLRVTGGALADPTQEMWRVMTDHPVRSLYEMKRLFPSEEGRTREMFLINVHSWSFVCSFFCL
jgi:hypothetical protein